MMPFSAVENARFGRPPRDEGKQFRMTDVTTADQGVVRWEEPPPGDYGLPPRPVLDYNRIAFDLCNPPAGTNTRGWAVVAEGGPELAALTTSIGSAQIRAFLPRGKFEAVCRRVGDRYTLYARVRPLTRRQARKVAAAAT